MKTTTHKRILLASAAAAVMGLGMISTPAMAFDDVNWEWDKLVTEQVFKDAEVTINVAPSGMLELEKMQIQIGDVTASSTVTNFTNNPPTSEVITAGAIGINGSYNEDYYNGIGPEPAPQPIPIGERLAEDLPKVESVATAVGNNQDIASSVSVELHDGQFLFGGYPEGGSSEEEVASLLNFAPDLGNTHMEVAAGMGLAGALGLIEPATISADSTVTGILNANVDSDATAVGNNMSVDLAAFTPDDAMMIADVTQVSYADVSATSLVDDVTINGYSDLGAVGLGPASENQIPGVSSTATAVGNNLSISVSSPAL